MGGSRPATDGATEAAKGSDEDAPAPDKDDDDETAAWESGSLYEEILDEADAFDYSGTGASGRLVTATYGD
jgi:NAD-dependent histone deacetylase SIR2